MTKAQRFEQTDEQDDVPLRFVEKQILAVSIENGFMTHSEGISILHTYCEVFATRGESTDVCICTSTFCQRYLSNIDHWPEHGRARDYFRG